MTTYYEVLNINKNATETDIKQAYRNLAKVHHPDKGGNKETFQKIQEAYDVLSDPNKKMVYDNELNGFNNFPNFPNFPNFGNNFFNNFFNVKQKRNNTVHILNLTLDNVFSGITKKFIIKRNFECKFCKLICPTCNGKGCIATRKNMGPIVIQINNEICQICKGLGKIKNQEIKCECCDSNGFTTEEKNIEISIEKGVENGKEYIFREWGEQAVNEGDIPGDCIIKVQIENHDIFTRNNLNLHITLKIKFTETVIGKIFKIPYFEEEFEFNTNSIGIINPIRDYIINGKGLENNKGEKGDLLVKFIVEYPTKILNDEEIFLVKNTFNLIKL